MSYTRIQIDEHGQGSEVPLEPELVEKAHALVMALPGTELQKAVSQMIHMVGFLHAHGQMSDGARQMMGHCIQHVADEASLTHEMHKQIMKGMSEIQALMGMDQGNIITH